MRYRKVTTFHFFTLFYYIATYPSTVWCSCSPGGPAGGRADVVYTSGTDVGRRIQALPASQVRRGLLISTLFSRLIYFRFFPPLRPRASSTRPFFRRTAAAGEEFTAFIELFPFFVFSVLFNVLLTHCLCLAGLSTLSTTTHASYHCSTRGILSFRAKPDNSWAGAEERCEKDRFFGRRGRCE